MNKKIQLVMPSSLNLEKLTREMEPEFNYELIKFKLITTKLYNTLLSYSDEEHEDGFCYIHSSQFQQVVKDYPKYINYMEQVGIIEINKHYLPNEYPRQYRLEEPYFYNEPKYEYIEDGRRAKKNEERRVQQQAKKKYIHLYKWLIDERLGFDEKRLSDVITEDFEKDQLLYPNDKRKAVIKRNNTLNACENIRTKTNIWHKVDSFGRRLHNNLTNMRSSARDCLTFDGEKLKGIDIQCSQPYFSIPIITQHTPIMLGYDSKTTINTNVERYINLILNDDIYLYFMNQVKNKHGENAIQEYKEEVEEEIKIKRKRKKALQLKGKHEEATKVKIPDSILGKDDRGATKNMFFHIYFSPANLDNRYKEVFKEVFPTVWGAIAELKKEDYKTFAKLLQREESSVILDKICLKLSKVHKEMPLYTVHDCIYTTEPYLQLLESVMISELEKATGYKPRLK